MKWKLWVLALVLVGCVTVEFTPMQTPPAPLLARSAAQVQVLTRKPSRAHVEVGMLKVVEEEGAAQRKLLDRLSQEAGRRGCEKPLRQIIIEELGHEEPTFLVTNQRRRSPAFLNDDEVR